MLLDTYQSEGDKENEDNDSEDSIVVMESWNPYTNWVSRTKAKDVVPKHLKSMFENFPIWMREGPWSPLSYVFLIFAFVALIRIYIIAEGSATYIETFKSYDHFVFYYRIILGIYMSFFCFQIARHAMGAFATYTITSWNLLIIRCFCSSIPWKPFQQIARFVKFPALAGHAITFFVWWLILFPAIVFGLRNDPKRQQGFINFNKSFSLINFHFLNFPFALVEFILSGEELQLLDFWFGLLIAILYLLFYLFIIQAIGFHIYIILSPRPHFSILVYFLLLGMYVGVFYGANAIISI